jgi:hypothetical protein
MNAIARWYAPAQRSATDALDEVTPMVYDSLYIGGQKSPKEKL